MSQEQDATAAPAEPSPTRPRDEDKLTRRLLYFLVGLLMIAALALLVVLFFLLKPQAESPTTAAEGYPIIPVRSLVAFGGDIQNPLNKPLGTTFDSQGNVWVADTGNGRVLVFGEDGASLRQMGDLPGPGKLSQPYGIALDENEGNAYVADFGSGRIQVYTLEGAYVTSIPNAQVDLKKFGHDGFFPYDVKVLGDRIVASSNNGLYFFAKDGSLLNRWGTKDRGIGYTQFNFPDAFTVDCAKDIVYVADSLNKRVVAVNSEGIVQWISGTPDANQKATGFWQLPRGITIGPEGNLYVVDTFRTVESGVGDGYFVVLNPRGELVSAFGRTGDEEDSFSFPEHVAFNGNDLWAVADREHNRVLLFKLAPIPAPDEPNVQEYPASFDAGPFPESVIKPLAEASEGATPGAPVGTDFSCPTAIAVAEGGIPWWVWLLVAIALALIIAAIRRLWKNRQAAAAGQPEGPPDGGQTDS